MENYLVFSILDHGSQCGSRRYRNRDQHFPNHENLDWHHSRQLRGG